MRWRFGKESDCIAEEEWNLGIQTAIDSASLFLSTGLQASCRRLARCPTGMLLAAKHQGRCASKYSLRSFALGFLHSWMQSHNPEDGLVGTAGRQRWGRGGWEGGDKAQTVGFRLSFNLTILSAKRDRNGSKKRSSEGIGLHFLRQLRSLKVNNRSQRVVHSTPRDPYPVTAFTAVLRPTLQRRVS